VNHTFEVQILTLSIHTTCHCTCQLRGSLCGVYLETHGEELAVLVARLEEADLVERLPLLVEKDVAALHLLVQNYGQRFSLYRTNPSGFQVTD
jgi:hypothetical protein